MEDLSCRELVELEPDYLDGALPPLEHARFEAHLSACTGCTRYVEQLRTTIAITGASRELEDRPEIAGLRAAFRGWHRRAH